jgi:hypothetical protein
VRPSITGQIAGGQLLQGAKVACGQGDLFEQLACGPRRGLVLLHMKARGRALHDGAVEEALRRRHRHQDGHLGAATRLAEDRHLACVTTEVADVVAHPLQRRHQVEHAGVASVGEARVGAFQRAQVAKEVEPVVDGDHHHVFLPRERTAVEHGRVACADGEGTAVQVDHDGALGGVSAGREDVEHQAVFAVVRLGGEPLEDAGARQEAPRAGGVGGIGDAFEHRDTFVKLASQLAEGGGDDGGRCHGVTSQLIYLLG